MTDGELREAYLFQNDLWHTPRRGITACAVTGYWAVLLLLSEDDPGERTMGLVMAGLLLLYSLSTPLIRLYARRAAPAKLRRWVRLACRTVLPLTLLLEVMAGCALVLLLYRVGWEASWWRELGWEVVDFPELGRRLGLLLVGGGLALHLRRHQLPRARRWAPEVR